MVWDYLFRVFFKDTDYLHFVQKEATFVMITDPNL